MQEIRKHLDNLEVTLPNMSEADQAIEAEKLKQALDTLLSNRAVEHSVHPTPLTLFGMKVEIANWLKPNQWFIRPSRRG